MQITEIKSSLPIATVLAHYRLNPDRNNRICCPFHDDKTPSMQVYPETNSVYCFSSSCKLKGKAIDQIDFIMHQEGCTKHEAIMRAKQMIDAAPEPTPNQSISKLEEPGQSLSEIFASQRKSLQRSAKALEYVKARELDPIKLEIGFNGYQSGWKQLQNCITFPLRDNDEDIVSLYGRSISATARSKHYYTKNRRGLYPRYPKAETETLIITEAIIDAASLASYLENETTAVLALYGTNGWNEEHTAAVKALSDLQEVIFFFDGDEAGNKAVETYASLVKVMIPGVSISKIRTPEGEDINSLLVSHEPSILTHLIDERDFLFSIDPRSDVKVEKTAEISSLTADQAAVDLDITNPEYIRWCKHDIDITVIGGVSLYPLDRMKVTLRIKRADSDRPMHSVRQTIDLYQDDLLEKLARKIAERLEMGSSKVQEALLELTELLERYRESENEKRKAKKVKKRELTPQRIERARAFLSGKNLHQRTNDAIGKTGMIGEEINRMILWYIFTSRLREKPLHVMCLGASGTGKTYLQERIGALIPQDHKKEITAMSDNAMYYFAEKELQHKLLLIEDLDGANEHKILYALRELMSKKYISKTIVIKDSKGNLKTITLEVKGPICLAGTTTRERLYEDNSNRSLLIYLDNSKAQKERIMDYQRKESAGKINLYEQSEMTEFLRDVQSVLRPIRVVNPYAEQLIIPEKVFKPLRTNSHYLQFIETVTFYHQLQRPQQKDERGAPYIATTIEDIEIANELLKEVLLAKCDELSKASRRFYNTLRSYVSKTGKDSFYSEEIRRAYRMAPATVGRHLKILTRYGYVKVVSGGRKKGFEYDLENNIEDLRSQVSTALDDVLNTIKSQEQRNEEAA